MKHTLRHLLMLLAVTLFIAPATHAQELVRVEKNGKYGLADKMGKIIIPYGYDYIEPFSEGMARVMQNRKYGFVNESGILKIPCKYDLAWDFSRGLARVRLKGKNGFIDKSGVLVIPCIYDDAWDFSAEGLAAVLINGEYGYIDKSGTMYEKLYAFSDGMAIVERKGKSGFIDKSGKLVIPCVYDEAWDFVDGIAAVVLKGEKKRIDKSGTLYDEVYAFSDGIAQVVQKGKYGFVDKTGTLVVPCVYDEIYAFSEGLATVVQNGKYGKVNKSGTLVLPCVYDKVYAFTEGMAHVVQNGKSGFIDNLGELVIPCMYDNVGAFSEELTWVKQGDRFGFINKYGELVIPCTYNGASIFSEGLAAVYQNGKWGYINKLGELVISCKYDDITPFAKEIEGVARIKLGDKWGYIDHVGNWYNSKQKAINAIAANPLLAQHEGYSGEDKVTIAQNKELAPAPQTPVAQPKSQPTPLPVTQPIAQPKQQPKPQPQPAPQPQVEAPVYASVDADIPQGKVLNDKTFVVIVANENYRREQGVEFALNDGEVFKRYCERTLGIPTEQIHLIPDATLNDLHAEVDWLCEVANTYEGEAKILFYYVGHGLPDESTRKAYLLPTDGYGSNVVKTGYPLQELYDRLSSIPTRQSLVLLDACFSGGQRDGKMMVSARGIAIAPEDDAPKNNLIVFSATQGDRMAYNYREMKHGMFTYYLLKKLQESKGNVTLGELTDYVKREVERRSIVVNRKKQTPTVMVGDGLTHTWQQISLR